MDARDERGISAGRAIGAEEMFLAGIILDRRLTLSCRLECMCLEFLAGYRRRGVRAMLPRGSRRAL